MKDNVKLKNILIFTSILLIFSFFYIVIDKYFFNDNIKDEPFLKNYKVNEFIPVYISDEDMARFYLNDYVNKMYFNPQEGYLLLDEEYKSKKYTTFSEYMTYINSLNYVNHKLDKYFVKESKGYKLIGAYDTYGNVFIFKTKGVMQYSVYLDDYTIEI